MIRYLPRSRAIEVGLPVADDWWLFDSLRVARMQFSSEGQPLGGELITDPEEVAHHQSWWELAVRHSETT